MLSTAFFIKVVSVALQYGILLFLFYFIYCLLKFMRADSKNVMKPIQRDVSLKEAVLTITEADDKSMEGRRFAFTDEISIGRGDDNDIVISDSYVSHHHAVITLVNTLYVLEDLRSVNHTYVNGKILEGSTWLQTGDLIRIGLVTFRFER